MTDMNSHPHHVFRMLNFNLEMPRAQNPFSGWRISGGYPADIRRKSGGNPADIRPPEESSGWIFRDVAGASLSPLAGTGRRVAAGGGRYDQTCCRHSPPCSDQWGERCARYVTENPSGGLLRRADIRRISAGYPP